MHQLWVLLQRRNYADQPRRACQLAYDLLKCNHPNVRSGLLFIPTGTRGICFDISKIYITDGVKGRVVKYANVSLWNCECAGSSFYCLYNISCLALDTGHTMWLSSLPEAIATLAGWLGEPWSTVRLSTQTVTLGGDVLHSWGSPLVFRACLGWSQHLKSLCCGGIHDWGPGGARSAELQAAAPAPGRVMASVQVGAGGPGANPHSSPWVQPGVLECTNCSPGCDACDFLQRSVHFLLLLGMQTRMHSLCHPWVAREPKRWHSCCPVAC